MSPANSAAWIHEPKGGLSVLAAPYSPPTKDEVVIKNEAIAIQPLDASIRGLAYVDILYPFILGCGAVGIIEEVSASVTRFKKGDRVVADTPTYRVKEAKYGGWQKYVVLLVQDASKML